MFAIPFSRSFKYLNDDIELNINYKENIKKLLNFFKLYQQSHHINILLSIYTSDFNQNEELNSLLKAAAIIKTQFPDASFSLGLWLHPTLLSLDNEKILDFLKNIPYQYYFLNPVSNLEDFYKFLQLKVSDIIIVGQLGFFVKFLHEKAKEKGIRIRTFCNICYSNNSLPSFKTFFIRPEEIDIYSKYIDIFEFAEGSTNLNTYYEIYAKDKKWYGLLKEIIIGYKGEQDNRSISPFLVAKRVQCGRKCLYKHCTLCDTEMILNESFRKQNIIPIIGQTNKNII